MMDRVFLVAHAKQAMKEMGWDKKEAAHGIMWMTLLLLLIVENELPAGNVKFPELLRILANVLEANIDLIEKENKNGKSRI